MPMVNYVLAVAPYPDQKCQQIVLTTSCALQKEVKIAERVFCAAVTHRESPSVLELAVGFEHLEWENEYEEELGNGEKADLNESIDVEGRDIQMIDSADMPVGVQIPLVRPDPSIPYMGPPPAPKRTENGEIVDPRIFDGALQMINGKWMVPRSCKECRGAGNFSDRNFPCEKCAKAEKACIRDEGLVFARCRVHRSAHNPIPASTANSSTAVADLLVTGNRNAPKNPTKRPRTAHTSARVKKNAIEREPTMEAVQAKKPPCIGRPPAWSDFRHDLCETLPYFRGYQGGCYQHDGLIFGQLLDGFGAPRDYIGGRIIVAHTGGKSDMDGDGNRVFRRDQTMDSTIKCMINNMRSKFPVATIMGNQCAYSPAKILYRYCVMDWFKVIAYWGERESASKHIRYKFRYEKLDTSTDGWWADRRTVEEPEPLLWKVCDKCKKSSMHIYEQGWMRVVPECPLFWTIDGNDPPENLTIEPPRTIFEPSLLLDPDRPIYTGLAMLINIVNDDVTYVRTQSSRLKDIQLQQLLLGLGKPYKFVVDVDSMPFDQAPEVINKALELIHKRVRLVFPEAGFNEILSVAYLEGQGMKYHDDGEARLGDTVASISLGASSRFQFRLKSKYVKQTQQRNSDVSESTAKTLGGADGEDRSAEKK
ncbi:hypothetical protein RUND412_007697 [Rhizina undulata]